MPNNYFQLYAAQKKVKISQDQLHVCAFHEAILFNTIGKIKDGIFGSELMILCPFMSAHSSQNIPLYTIAKGSGPVAANSSKRGGGVPHCEHHELSGRLFSVEWNSGME